MRFWCGCEEEGSPIGVLVAGDSDDSNDSGGAMNSSVTDEASDVEGDDDTDEGIETDSAIRGCCC
jgi:hypothetical protein